MSNQNQRVTEQSSTDTQNVIEEINFNPEGDDGLNVFTENGTEEFGNSGFDDDSEYDTPSFLRPKNKENNDLSKNNQE